MGMMKRTVSFLLVLLLLVGLVPAASAAGVWHSGDCGAVGSNVTWSLYTDGALVISGSGAMEDYYLNDINYGYMTSTAPWYEWEMYITSVRVEDGITRVGDYAFHNLWWVETVKLGADVKTIGAYAFFGLGNLKTVTIPNNVASIGEYAFAECSAVSELVLGSGVTTIGEGAFYYCGALEKVDIPNSVKTLGNNAFDSCYNVTSLNIGTGVKALPVAVFSGLNKLSSVTIPGNVKSIGRLAFHGCKALKEVALSEGVQVLLERAFSECALETIYFPASVSSIGALAFADCGALSLAIFNGDAPAVEEDAFSGCAPEFVINYPAPSRGWATPVWNGYPAYPFDPFGTLPETWPVNIGAHVVTVASTRLGQDGKMTPLKGATVQILTKSGTIHTGTTDENGQYAYHNNDGKELRISADGYQLLRAIYPMNIGESRIFTLDPLPADGAPYFSMLCGMLKTGKEFRDLRTEAVHYQKDDGMYMEPLFEIVAGDDIVIDSVLLVQTPDSVDLSSSGRSIELTELAFYDAADPFRHIRAEADRFAPGAFYEQRPICAAISYRYKGDPSAQIYNSEPVRLKLFIDPKPEVVKPGESNAVNTADGTMAQGAVAWLGNVAVDSLHTLFTEFLQADPSVKSDLLNFQYTVETDTKTGNRKLRFAIGLGSGGQEFTVFGTPAGDPEGKGFFQKLRDWIDSREMCEGKPLDFLSSEVGKELEKEFGETAVNSISKVEGEVLGYYEVELDPEGNIVPESEAGRLLANIAGKVTTGKTILIHGFPAYFEHVAEVSVAATLDPELVPDPVTKQPLLSVGMDKLELNIPKLSLEGGAGIRGVATVGIGGVFENLLTVSRKAAEATTSLVGTTNAYFRVYVAFLVDFQKNFGTKGGGKITLYEYPKDDRAGSDQILTGQSLVRQATEPKLELTEREYLQNRSRWNGQPIRLMRNADLSTLQTGVLPNAMPRLETVDGRQMMLFLADDGTRELGSHTRLMYSLLENGIWSEPRAVWDNGTGDLYFDCVVVNGQLVVVWQKLRSGIADGDAMEMLHALAARSEIALAVWDGDDFTRQQYLTDDDTLDMIASAAADGDGVHITWVTNDENDLMGTAGENTIRTVTFRGGSVSMPADLYTTDRFLTELTSVVSGGRHHVFFALTNSEGSTDLIHLTDKAVRTVAEGGAFAGLNAAEGCFLWQEGGSIYRYSPTLGQQEELIRLDSGSVSSSYRFVTNGQSQAVVWAEGQEPCRIAASIRTGDGWSEPVVLEDDISQSVTFLDAALTADGSFVLAVNTADLTDGATQTALRAGVITPAGDVTLASAAPGRPDGDVQPLSLILENKGLLPVEEIRLTVSDGGTVLVDKQLDVTLAPGSRMELTEQVQVSGWTELTVRAEMENDRDPTDNARTVSLGHADTALALDVYEQEDTVIFLLTASNASAVPADTAIRVFRETAAGEAVASMELGTLTRDENLQYIYTLDKNAVDFGVGESVYYLFRLACGNDWDESDNVRAWRVEKPAVFREPDELEPMPVILPRAVEILSGDMAFADPDVPGRKLAVRITPENAAITAVTWHSADEHVARVLPDGTVVPVGSGSTTITAILTEELTDSITVTVGERMEIHEHTVSLAPGFGATCTEAGLTDGAHCAECGEVLTAQEEIPALGHDWRSTDCIRCDATRSNPFRDVPLDSFYIDPVLWAVERGITTGTSATTFDPNGQCMRAVVVTFLWRAAGEPEPVSSNNPFRDVKKSDFFYKAVLWAVEKGITNGLEAGRFGPYDYCNRAQVVTFLYRAMGKPAVKDPYNPFTDVPAGSFYHMPVIWAVEQGITNGMSAASFGSDAVCNRAQIVTFLFRAMG